MKQLALLVLKINEGENIVMSDIKLIALGGVRENGKNLYVVEVNDSIFILDAGLKYPENEQLVLMRSFQI